MKSRALRPVHRLVLRPGTHVLRRSATELQVGLDPERAVILPDRPDVRTLLGTLSSPASLRNEQEYDDRTVALLADSGLLVDADRLLPLAPAPPPPLDRDGAKYVLRVSRTDVAALAANAGDRAAELLESRRRARIDLVTSGSGEALHVAAVLTELLAAAGADIEPREHAVGDTRARPSAGVIVTVGEPQREELDDWMRAGTPHLLLRLVEGHAVIGPFVIPGETACLRCLDAHHTDLDPAWPLLLTQYASAVVRDREDTLPEPVDTLLAQLACAWAARELVSHAEGRRPATASTTVRLDPHLTALESHCWPRHPACGCTWV
jgi:bacteriocin biosynthesis cyclodehydratase domain-containing protein